MLREIEIRLIGHQSADGELLAADAIRLVTSFKELAYRLTRLIAERSGLGRTDAVIERLATVRVALRPGSTRIVFIVGDQAALVDPLAEQVDAAFWSIVGGLEANARPRGISDSVADAVDNLVVALAKAAPQMQVTTAGRSSPMLQTQSIARGPWQRSMHENAGKSVLHGLLEMVDLRSARFRLRDAADTAVDLIDVVDAENAAHWVGERVTATGVLAVGRGTQHHRMETPTIARAESAGAQSGIEARLQTRNWASTPQGS